MFPKGGMGNLMKQAKEMQTKMAKAQEEVKLLKDEATSGGGLVRVCINGEKKITSICSMAKANVQRINYSTLF